MKIREFNPTAAEYEAMVAVHNAVWPDDPETVAAWRYWDESRNPKYRFRRYVLEIEGDMVAYSRYRQTPWSYQPGKFDVDVHVHPEYQRKGLGSTLYRHLMEALAPLEPTKLTADTREDQLGGVRFLEKQGFRQVMRHPISKLELATFKPERFAERVTGVLNGGIIIKSLATLQQETPAWRQKCHELEWELLQDVPSPDPMQKMSLEDYEKRVLEHPNFLAEGYFVALDGDRWIGMSNFWQNAARPERLSTGLTGVVRSHRRRGIATALKVKALTFAQERGAQEVETGNEEKNPMLRLNVQLGFRPTPAWLEFAQDLHPESISENGGNDVSTDKR